MGSLACELPNLQKLHLSKNKFTRINFSLLKLPRLKCLTVSNCKNLVELLKLPSNIVVLVADYCSLLKSIGAIANCKWLCKVSLINAGPIVGHGKLDSIYEGNAIEDHFISLAFSSYVKQMGFEDRFVRGERFTLQLPHKFWYDDFSGFAISIVTRILKPYYTIILKPEMSKDFQSEVWQESDEAPETHPDSTTYVGYVSFNFLMRHIPWWTKAYNAFVFTITSEGKDTPEDGFSFKASLVSRKSKGDVVQTTEVATDCSEFWEKRFAHRRTFTIQHDSYSSIEIVWRHHLKKN